MGITEGSGFHEVGLIKVNAYPWFDSTPTAIQYDAGVVQSGRTVARLAMSRGFESYHRYQRLECSNKTGFVSHRHPY